MRESVGVLQFKGDLLKHVSCFTPTLIKSHSSSGLGNPRGCTLGHGTPIGCIRLLCAGINTPQKTHSTCCICMRPRSQHQMELRWRTAITYSERRQAEPKASDGSFVGGLPLSISTHRSQTAFKHTHWSHFYHGRPLRAHPRCRPKHTLFCRHRSARCSRLGAFQRSVFGVWGQVRDQYKIIQNQPKRSSPVLTAMATNRMA